MCVACHNSSLQVDLYSQADNIMYGNKTVTVYKNSVKFSTAITNWNFNDARNQLRYTIFLSSQGRGGSSVQGCNDSNSTRKNHFITFSCHQAPTDPMRTSNVPLYKVGPALAAEESNSRILSLTCPRLLSPAVGVPSTLRWEAQRAPSFQ